MSAPLRKGARRPRSDTQHAADRTNTPPPLFAEGDAHVNALPGPSPAVPCTIDTVAAAAAASGAVTGPSAHLSRPATTLLRRPSGLQSAAPATSTAAGGRGRPTQMSDAAAAATHRTSSPTVSPGNLGAGLRKNNASTLGRSPNGRSRPSFGPSPPSGGSGAQSPVLLQSFSPFAVPQTRASATPVIGSPSSAAPTVSTLPGNTPLGGLSNHLRLSEGLSCIDYHAGFRALAIGSTRQIHVVEVIPMVGHDVAATARYKRSQEQQQEAAAAAAAAAAGEDPSAMDGEQPYGSPTSSPPPPPPTGTAPFLMRNTGVFGGLIKVESVAWYPSTEEASLAFIQPGRTVTIFLDALQFKADGTYLPQQWTRSQYKGKTLSATMAAGGGSTAMAVVANLDGGLAGMTPATSNTSLGERSGMYTPVSTSLAGGASFGGASASHGGTPHETSLPMPNSGGGTSGPSAAMSTLPCVYRERKGPAAKELIELNIDITYMRVEKIVWDPHQPYTLALSSPTTHFELWQVPTEEVFVYAPQLVLRPPAHNTRSVVRDIVFSPSNPHIIVVVTESGNTGQVLLYDRRQVEATRVFDVSGPGLSAAFHPLFSDLLAISFRKEKTKPDTRISFLRVMSGSPAPKPASATATAGPAAISSADAPLTVPLMNTATLAAAVEECTGGGGVPASACPYLAEQTFLPPIDNYACVSRMRWRPPSLGRLTEPKRHHYMAFKPSAEDLWAARHYLPTNAPGDEDMTWADILHSQLWFATAAVTTDSDLSVWDGANGFFPVFAVKYLGTRTDTSSSNEANDFIWINELTVVSIFKSGEVICTSFLNSLLQKTLLAGEAHKGGTRTRRDVAQQSHRSRSAASQPRLTQQQQQQQQHDGKARDDYVKQHDKTRLEEQSCLAMLPAYPHDPCADMFATYIVLPTSSTVSDLFGRSFTIRNSDATVRHRYHVMMRREFGQLLRRLAIQVSREAVLRRQWSEMRYQLPVGSPGGPGLVSGLAALQELRSRRPRSPFTQTLGFHGHGTSSQGSDSTPPSPRRSMLTRRCSVASSASSFSARMGAPLSAMVGLTSERGGAAGQAGLYSMAAPATTASAAAHGGQPKPSPRPRPASPSHTWSLEDVNDALLSQASQQAAGGSPTTAHEGGEGDGAVSGLQARSAMVHVGSANPAPEIDDGLGGVLSGCEDDETGHDEGDADADTTRTSPQHLGATSAEIRGGGGASRWIARILGFARHERVHRYRASAAVSRAESVAHAGTPGSPEAADVYDEDEDEDDAAASADEAALSNHGDSQNSVSLLFSRNASTAVPPRQQQQQQSTAAGLRGGPTSPIRMSPVEDNESSIGSPQLAGAGAGSPLQPPNATGASGTHPRVGSTGIRPGTSPGSSSSPPLTAPITDVGATAQHGVLYRAAGGSTNQNSTAVASPGLAGHIGYKNRRSGVIFTQLFPLMTEYVSIGQDRGAREGRSSRSSSAPTQRSASRADQTAAVTATPVERVLATSAAVANNAKDFSMEQESHRPVPPLSPSQQTGAASRGGPPTQTSPLLLPLCASGSAPSATNSDVNPTATARATTGAPRSLTVKDGPTPSHLITARAYLDRQRDVTVVLESFALSDVVCGWSYTERKREELAFVRFALEWDMGYELALTMKALRHDRIDAEAAAEAAMAAEVAHASGPYAQDVKSGGGHVESGMQRTHSTDSTSHGNITHRRGNRRRSSSSGSAQHHHHHHRDPLSQRNARPRDADSPAFSSRKTRSRSEGARGTTRQRRGVDDERHFKPLVDWGRGTPAPTHREVDDKLAAMMEENARRCELATRQQRRDHRDWHSSANLRSRSPGSNATASVTTSYERGAEAAGDGEGGVVTMATAKQGPVGAEGGETSSRPPVAADGSLKTTDPRAQWWRAAAHAWRSHHVSFIIAITVQQLEYASLMGDVQYCLVLYILFCLWWRLHGEVAEAAYGAAARLVYRAKHGAERDAYWQLFATLRDSGGADIALSHGNWAGEKFDRKGVQMGDPAAHAPAQHAMSGEGIVKDRAAAAADRRRGVFRVSTMTSVDDSCHGAGSVVGPDAHYLRATRSPHALSSPYDTPGASEGELGQGQVDRECGRDGCVHNRDTVVSPLQLSRLHQLCLFFRRCPLMPMLPEAQPRSASTATTATAATGPTAVPAIQVSGSSVDAVERGPTTSGIGGGGGNFAGYLRVSASNQSLPTRSQNSSARRLTDTPTPPAIPDGPRGHGSQRASTTNLTVMAGSQRSTTASAAPPLLRVDGWNGSKQGEQVAKSAAAAAARANDARLMLVDVEGLLGVCLYAQSADDLCAPADYCPPEEWKLRALQWLETYTADLYSRQLYVPLNELLLVMPEIFMEPTNPVQPRAADIAYEKQMTYVYCGTCAKAELWSRTQQDTVPAAVRLYERVMRRGHLSSSSEDEEEDDEDTDSSDKGHRTIRRGRRHHRRSSEHDEDEGYASLMGDGEESPQRKRQSRRRLHRQQRQQQRRLRRYAAGSEEGSGRDSNDDSSMVFTPSVESPTSSSASAADESAEAVRLHERGNRISSMNSDVSLSSEHSTHGGRDSAEEHFDPTVAHHSRDGSSHGSTAGGSRAGLPSVPFPLSTSQLQLQDYSAEQQQQQQQRRRLRSRPSRRSLDNEQEASYRNAYEHETDRARNIGPEGREGGHGVDGTAQMNRHTAVGCGEAGPATNNAVCRRCVNHMAMTCVICEEVVEGVFFWLRSCGHGGHVHHMEEWLRYSQECPKCGTPITATWKGS